MKTERIASGGTHAGRALLARRFIGVGLLLALALTAAAQVQVTTLGGGPRTLGGSYSGYWDGAPVQDSQFNFPSGLTLNPAGDLLIADRDNGRVRLLSFTANRVFTTLANLSQPVDVAFDGATNFYVLNQGNGTIFKYDVFGNRITPDVTGLVNPTAMALDNGTNIYVTELGGAVKRVTPAGVVSTLRNDLNQPRGIEVLDTGSLVVSDTGNHALRLINPTNSVMTLLTGGNGAGFADGFPAQAKLNLPHAIARAANGLLVVADRGNNRIRYVTTNGIVTTLYGTNSVDWASDYPGWEDGDPVVAEAREPVGLAVAKDGTVYSTEVFYHLIRQATGGPFTGTGSGNGGDGTNSTSTNIVAAPVISPNFGYYPMGQLINVSSAVGQVYYTTDGTEPTTNSRPVNFSGGIGRVLWQETLRDLTSLRLKAFDGTNSSVTVGGVPSPTNHIGVARDIVAGIGSTVLIPVVVNLRSQDQVRSLQFRAEVTPSGAAPMISDQFRAVSVSTNDFIPVAVSSEGATGAAQFNYFAYANGTTRGVAIAYISTNANISIKSFGTVAMLAVPIPRTAQEGQQYSLRLLAVTGTSDAQQTPVEVAPLPPSKIVVGKVSYLVGDSSISKWYNAEQFGEFGEGAFGFGDGKLQNNDVNNAFVASFGLRVPYSFSDLFNAMDVYPQDIAGTVGGDGQIRYLDWQVLLGRSLGLDSQNWRRTWSPGGVLIPSSTTLTGFANGTAAALVTPAWAPQVRLSGITQQDAPIGVVNVPVEVTVTPGHSLAGLQFRAVVTPDGDAPALDKPVQFIPAEGIPTPLPLEGLPSNQVGGAWSLYANPFQPAITGTLRIGVIRFTVPQYARSSHSYSVHFANADGSPVPIEDYTFETIPGSVWVLSRPLQTPTAISDEWKVRFFGSYTTAMAQDGADPDGDGVSNLAEYQAGTDPTLADSRLQLSISYSSSGQVTLLWQTAPGRNYIVESSTDLTHWTAIGGEVAGTGGPVQINESNAQNNAQYYRVRLSP